MKKKSDSPPARTTRSSQRPTSTGLTRFSTNSHLSRIMSSKSAAQTKGQTTTFPAAGTNSRVRLPTRTSPVPISGRTSRQGQTTGSNSARTQCSHTRTTLRQCPESMLSTPRLRQPALCSHIGTPTRLTEVSLQSTTEAGRDSDRTLSNGHRQILM